MGAAGQADEARAVLGDLIQIEGAFALGGAHLHHRDEAREVLVALAVFHEDRQPGAVLQGQLAADERADAGARGGLVEARGAVEAVAVDQRQHGHVEARGFGDERFGLFGGFKKREGRLRVELDEHRSRGSHGATVWRCERVTLR
jgi:hypothetical protein